MHEDVEETWRTNEKKNCSEDSLEKRHAVASHPAMPGGVCIVAPPDTGLQLRAFQAAG
jgi:hypothetical protein